MAGICTDGDSAMVGEEQGLSARLKAVAPMLFSVHCSAHRVALVQSNVAEASAEIKQLESVLKNVSGLFKGRTRKFKQWETFAKKNGVTRFKFPTFTQVRWWSREDAINVLVSNIVVLMRFLQKYKNPRKDGKRGPRLPHWKEGAEALEE